jgi:hypothetical protein
MVPLTLESLRIEFGVLDKGPSSTGLVSLAVGDVIAAVSARNDGL